MLPKIYCLVAVLLSIVSRYAVAQKPPVKFGDVSKEELEMKVYDKDSSAAAVILADYGESVILYSESSGFKVEFERITRIKILKKAGYEWANFEIPLYHEGNSDKETISGLKGITYNLEGGKIVESKVKGNDAFEEEYNESLDIVKLALPDVKEGSVIEITYRIFSDFLVEFRDWEFQSTIPAVLSEYRARIPEYFHYEKYMQGYLPLTINEEKINNSVDFRENAYRWAIHDVPAFKEEPYMTTYKDYISRMNFELAYTHFPNRPVQPIIGTWADISEKLQQNTYLGAAVKGNGFLRKIVEQITADITEPAAQIDAISHYVKQNVVWNGNRRKFISTSLRKALDDKKGSSADINLLFASMLEKQGFEVYPVLVSTRDHGFVRTSSPMLDQFNYVICAVKIEDQYFLLDATERLLPTGVLPERCLNGDGLMIAGKKEQWLPLASSVRSKSLVTAQVNVTAEGIIKGSIKFDNTGYDAFYKRKEFFSNGEEEFAKSMFDGKTWAIGEVSISNSEKLSENFIHEYAIEVSDHATIAGDVIYLNPFIYLLEEENPFKMEKREYPVDFGSPFDRIYISQITIPEGYDVEELPASQMFRLPDNGGKYLRNVVRNGNVITVTSMLNINMPIFTQLEYPNLREFYSLMIAKQEEQIVLKKI